MSKRKEMIKIRAESNEIENNKIIHRINEAKAASLKTSRKCINV